MGYLEKQVVAKPKDGGNFRHPNVTHKKSRPSLRKNGRLPYGDKQQRMMNQNMTCAARSAYMLMKAEPRMQYSGFGLGALWGFPDLVVLSDSANR